jgi:hypothetical protein
MKTQNPYKYMIHFLFLGLLISGLLGFTQLIKADDEGKHIQRGAQNVKQITKTAFNALKMDDFEMLQSYLPNDEDLAYLRKYHKEVIVDESSAEVIKSDLNKNFHQLMKSGIDKKINWTTIELIDSSQKTGVNRNLCNMSLTLDDHKSAPIKINVQAIKIKEKWFLFDGFHEVESVAKDDVKI